MRWSDPCGNAGRVSKHTGYVKRAYWTTCNFIAIQQAQGISAKGYTPTPLRTGYERVLSHRTDDIFAHTAKQPGRVVSVNDEAVEIENEDGSTERLEIGRRYGVSAGTTYPYNVVADVKEGQTIKKGDIVTHNSNFFEPDPLDPKQVVWKAGVLTRTVLAESSDTLEDSSAISSRIAEKLTTDSTEVRDIRVNFEQSIHNLVSAGDKVSAESILCNIENPVTSDNKLFDEEALETLKLLSSQNPKAKKSGFVERVEVFYNGDKDDMSESLRKVSDRSDKKMRQRSKDKDFKGYNGQVDSSFKAGQQSLGPGFAVIRLYITGPHPAGSGD